MREFRRGIFGGCVNLPFSFLAKKQELPYEYDKEGKGCAGQCFCEYEQNVCKSGGFDEKKGKVVHKYEAEGISGKAAAPHFLEVWPYACLIAGRRGKEGKHKVPKISEQYGGKGVHSERVGDNIDQQAAKKTKQQLEGCAGFDGQEQNYGNVEVAKGILKQNNVSEE